MIIICTFQLIMSTCWKNSRISVSLMQTIDRRIALTDQHLTETPNLSWELMEKRYFY